MAGRLVLINSILFSLPIYFMTVLKLPQWVMKEIDKIRRRFLWHGANEQQRGYNLVNWKGGLRTKNNRGPGHIGPQNLQLRLTDEMALGMACTETQAMEATVTPNCYIPRNPLTCMFSALPQEMRQIFNVSTQWKVGDGAIIQLWDHDWGEGQMRLKLPNLYSFTKKPDISVQTEANELDLECIFRPNLSTLAKQELVQLTAYISRLTLRQGI